MSEPDLDGMSLAELKKTIARGKRAAELLQQALLEAGVAPSATRDALPMPVYGVAPTPNVVTPRPPAGHTPLDAGERAERDLLVRQMRDEIERDFGVDS